MKNIIFGKEKKKISTQNPTKIYIFISNEHKNKKFISSFDCIYPDLRMQSRATAEIHVQIKIL